MGPAASDAPPLEKVNPDLSALQVSKQAIDKEAVKPATEPALPPFSAHGTNKLGISPSFLSKLTLLHLDTDEYERGYIPTVEVSGRIVQPKLKPLVLPLLLKRDRQRLQEMEEQKCARKWCKMVWEACPESVVEVGSLWECWRRSFGSDTGPATLLRTILKAIDGTDIFAVDKSACMLLFGLRPRAEALTLQSTDRAQRRYYLGHYVADSQVSPGKTLFAQHLASDPIFPLPPGQASRWHTRLCERNRLPQAEYYALNAEEPAFPGTSLRKRKLLREAEQALEEACARETAARTPKQYGGFGDGEGSQSAGGGKGDGRDGTEVVAASEIEDVVGKQGTWAQGEFERREAARAKWKPKRKNGKGRSKKR